jgi:hypothetical protein
MPSHIIERVNEMARAQGMPSTLTFGDQHANEIEDDLDKLIVEADANDDESYQYDEEDDVPLLADRDSDEDSDSSESS